MILFIFESYIGCSKTHCCQASDIIFFLCYNDQATDIYIYILKHTQPYAFRVSGALFDESVKRLVQFIPFPQHANSSLTPLGQLRWCMIITVNCEFCETLGRRWCLPFFERWLLCVFAGTFSAGWLLSHVRIWTEASHQWLFTHRQGVVESMLHICSHLAPCSDKKNNILHRGGLHAKLLYGNVHIYTSVSIIRMRHDLQYMLTLWDGSSLFGFYISILSSPASQFDDST